MSSNKKPPQYNHFDYFDTTIDLIKIYMETQSKKREKVLKWLLEKYKDKPRNLRWLTILGWVYNEWEWSNSKLLLDFDLLEFRKDWEVLKYIFLNKKQKKAWKRYQDNSDPTVEIVYWGWAGWGKSFLLTLIVFINALLLEESGWFIGRRVLKDVRTTTISDLIYLMYNCWFEDYNHNHQDSIIKFKNKSFVKYWELENLPSDPTFKRIGSNQFTGIFIDEAQETVLGAKSALMYRLRLTSKTSFNTDWTEKVYWKKKGKMYYSCNPGKNWLFTDFYLPFEKWLLDNKKDFIQALPWDNEFLDDETIDLYKNNDNELFKQIYYFWNWHYDNDPKVIFTFDDLNQIFINDISPKSDNYYMTIDLAWRGKDKTVVIIWKWYTIEYIYTEDKTNEKDLIQKLEEFERNYWIKRQNVVVDSSWLGSWFEDFYNGCVRFLWGSKSIEKKEDEMRKIEKEKKDFLKEYYSNDRSACFFKLSEVVKKGWVYIKDQTYKEDIINELSFIKEEISTTDTNVRKIISKENIKKLLWRSPDFADSISMRMIFEFKIEEKEDIRTVEDFNIFF